MIPRNAVLACTATALLAASPAGASFHLAHIERVMTGLGGSTDVQFVEIVMDATSQHLVTGTELLAFHADGTFSHVVLTVPANPKILSGNDRPWIMASAAFQAESGIPPDYVFDSTGGNGLPAEDGMVCWGQAASPAQNTNPSNMVDCVSYGDYTGPDNFHTDAPSTVSPFGHGIVRVSSTGSSAEDFSCEDPAIPHNNAFAAGSIDASIPCTASECGDGSVVEPEDCDDGNTEFKNGDFCSAECTAVPCGVPTNQGFTPRTADALFVLRTSVSLATCDLRVCDVNNSNSVTTGDALIVLRKAVGQGVTLICPT